MAKEQETEEEIEENTEDEEDSEEKEPIQETKFRDENEFVPEVNIEESTAPVLKKIQDAPQIRTLEQSVASSTSPSQEREDPFQYIPKQEDQEINYTSSQEEVRFTPERVDLAQVGRNASRFEVPQGNFFTQSPSAKAASQDSEYKIVRHPEKTDPQSLGREGPFEKEKKYDVERPHY